MRLSSLVLTLIMFVGLFVGVQSFGLEMLASSGVDAQGLSSVEDKQDELKKKWGEESTDQSTWREESGIVQDAIGVSLVPRIITDLIDVSTNFKEILNEVGKYRWVPSWTSTMFSSLISAGFFFAVAGAYLRYRL